MKRRAATLIEVLVVMGIIAVLTGLLLSAVQMARRSASAVTCKDRLKQIGIALQLYHDGHGALPPGCSYQGGKDPYLHMSWCTRLLPFLEQGPMWEQAQKAYAQEKSFLRRPPHQGTRAMPPFLCPGDPREVYHLANRDWAGFTFYLGVEGTNQISRDGMLYLDSKVKFAEVTDGLSNTILVGERPPSADGVLGWWYAGWGQSRDGSAEMILGAREIARWVSLTNCPDEANHYHQGKPSNQCDALHFWSVHPGGAHFLFADGSVRFLSYSADGILPALATRAGGEAVTAPD